MAIGPNKNYDGLIPARPPRFSLLTVPGVIVTEAEKVAGADPNDPNAARRWENGVSIEPETCSIDYDLDSATADYPYWWECPEGAGVSPVDANVNGTGTKSYSAPPSPLTFQPYTIHRGYSCSAPDVIGRKDDAMRRAARALEACTPGAVEHELWTGEVAYTAGWANPYLADPANATVISAAGYGFVTALAELEDALSECGCGGRHMIHAEPRVVTHWASRDLVHQTPDGQALETILGTTVVPGVGYPGSGRAIGGDAGEGAYNSSVAFGSGLVRVFLGDVVSFFDDAGAIDRTDNDYVLRAERAAVAVFDDCCVRAVPVLLCDEYCGSGS